MLKRNTNTLRSSTLTSLLILSLLTACSSGGGKSKNTQPVVDTTPDTFSISAQGGIDVKNLIPNALFGSEAITISGINVDTPISISGGQYVKEGQIATSEPGTVKNGDTIRVLMASPSEFGQSATVSLKVGTLTVSLEFKTQPTDTTPDAFTIQAPGGVDLTQVEINKDIISAPITVTGINTATPISITGGEYAIAGGAYTAATGTVFNNQMITVKIKSPKAFAQSLSATTNVGGVTKEFKVTTEAEDKSPDAITINASDGTDLSKAEINSTIFSKKIIISGINTSTPVSITGGEYSIDGGAYTNAAGEINKGQNLTIKIQTPVKSSQNVKANLIVGDRAAEFAATTQQDTTPPEVAIIFPTENTMTEGETLILRGTIKDQDGNLKAENPITVEGVELAEPVKISDLNEQNDSATWIAKVKLPLNKATNLHAENEDLDRTKITVRGLNVAGLSKGDEVFSRRVPTIENEYFPDNRGVVLSPGNVELNKNKTHLILTDKSGLSAISLVDMSTGKREVIYENDIHDLENGLIEIGFINDLQVDKLDNFYVVDDLNSKIFILNPLIKGKREYLTSATHPGITKIKSCEVDYANEHEYFYALDGNRVIKLKEGDYSGQPFDVTIDGDELKININDFLIKDNNTIIALDSLEGLLNLVAIENGKHVVSPLFSLDELKGGIKLRLGRNDSIYYMTINSEVNESVALGKLNLKSKASEYKLKINKNEINYFSGLTGFDIIDELGLIVFASSLEQALYLQDSMTGERVLISKLIAEY
jgi:hypothetical protein